MVKPWPTSSKLFFLFSAHRADVGSIKTRMITIGGIKKLAMYIYGSFPKSGDPNRKLKIL